jgi:hypothetical protein
VGCGRAGCVLWGGLITSAALLARPATAFHTDEQRITDDTAYTLKKKDVRLGLWKAQYGIFDPLTAGTYVWPWLLRISNLELKCRFYESGPWAFAASTGFFYFDTKHLKKAGDAGDARIADVPFEIDGSYRFESPYTLSVGLVWTEVLVDGTVNQSVFQGAGQGAISNFQLTSTFELRISEVTALVFHARSLVFQRARAAADAVTHPDAFTTVEIHATGRTNALDYRGAGSFTVSGVWSWKTFNLRAGIGYGNYNVPGLNFVIGNRILYPELDLYWIF